MGSRKENLKKSLGITEYPWSSDEDEDMSDQRANTNTQEPQTTTSQQRPTNEIRTNPELYRTISPNHYKPFLPTLPQIIETSVPHLRHTLTLSQQMDCGLQPYNEDRFRSYRNVEQNESSSLPSHARFRQTQVIEPRKNSANTPRVFSFKKLTRGMTRQRNRPANSIAVSPRCSQINRLAMPLIPDMMINIHSRSKSGIRRINAINNKVASLFTLNNADVPEVPTSSCSHLQQPRIFNINTDRNGPADAVPDVDTSFSDNDAEETATIRPDRTDSHMIQENLEDPAVESSADAITLETNAIATPEDFVTNSNHNLPAADGDGNANDEPTPSTSSLAITSEPQATGGATRKRYAHDEEGDINAKEFNQGLLRLLECPVCLDWMEPPISQCRRGHLVCSRCQSRLSACPVCRSMFSSVRNRAMEGVAEMLRYPCRHGCGREVRLRRRGPHEASCSARKYQCPALSCSERMPLPYSELAQHFQMKHFSMLMIGKKHTFSMKMNAEHHDNWLILAFDELFHLRVDVDFPTWGIVAYVSYIGPKCKASSFIYEVRVDGQHHARRIVYTRVTHSDLESPSMNRSRQDCFHLNLDQALNYIRSKNRNYEPEKYLNFHVEISRSNIKNTDEANSDS